MHFKTHCLPDPQGSISTTNYLATAFNTTSVVQRSTSLTTMFWPASLLARLRINLEAHAFLDSTKAIGEIQLGKRSLTVGLRERKDPEVTSEETLSDIVLQKGMERLRGVVALSDVADSEGLEGGVAAG